MSLLSSILAFALFALTPATGQMLPWSFSALPSDSLPADEVSSLYQDSDGFIWIITYNSLVRFDGYETKSYSVSGAGDNHVDRYLHTAIEDDEGHILIGTERGLLSLDKRSEVLTGITDASVDNMNVNKFVKDSSGRIWVCGNKGLFFRDKGKSSFSRLDLRTDFQSSGLTDLIDICMDDNRNLWITTWQNGLYRYNLETGSLFPYLSGALKLSYVLRFDVSGNLWIGTWGAGLLRIDAANLGDENPAFEQFLHDKSSSSILDDIIYAINQDAEGNILVGSRSGLSVLRDGMFYNYFPDDTPGSLPYNEVNSILCTRDNSLWLGMFGGGVCKVNSRSSAIERMELPSVRGKYKTNSVKSIYRIDSTEYLFGIAGHGFIKYNRAQDSFVNYQEIPSFKGLLYTSVVEDIMRREDSGEICFASYDRGLWLYDPAGNTTKVFNSANSSLSTDCIRALEQDKEGNVFLGTRYGAFVLDKEDSIQRICSWFDIKGVPVENMVVDLGVDKDGSVWMATDYGGIIKMDAARHRAISYEINDGDALKSFSSILIDSSDNVWAGSTWDGLYTYDAESDSFRKLDELVFIKNKGIRNLEESEDGRIWVTTSTQVVSFSYIDGEIDGIWYQNISEGGTSVFFNQNVSSYMPEDSVMAFGSSHGVLLFPCTFDQTENDVSNLSLTGFSAGGKSIEGINALSQITLKHNQNDILIRFSLMDYNNPQGNVYRYRLIRAGDEAGPWMIANGDNNSALFTHLAPGRYTFEACGARSGGFITSRYRTLSIHIKHNPWTSWWAILVYLTLALAAISFAVQSVKSKVRIKRQMELDQLHAQKAEEVNQAKLRFFTNVSHEFLTPLSIIMASIESLQPKSESNKRIANIMSVNSVRLMRLVQQVLEFRKVESDNLKLKVSYNDVANFIGHCVEAFQPLVRKRSLILTYDADPQKIEGWYDPDKLDKIMYNLISNAVKYTPEGGSIKVSAEMPASGTLVIKCINSGEVMDSKTRSGLFKRFYEGDYRKFNTIGHGLGLSLVKSLVDKHKGKIEVEGSEEMGNCFKVTLPIAKENYSAAEIDTDTIPIFPLAFSMGEHIVKDDHTVLLVDDNEDLLSTFAAIMSKRFNVLTCNSAVNALKILDSEAVDVVVADVMMPDMDGFELCSKIKGQVQTSHIPVILLTALKDDKSSIEGYSHGADGYLTKPCNFSVLSAMIANLLKKQARKSEDFRKQLVFEIKDIDYTSMDKKFLQKAIDIVNNHIADADFSQTDFVNAMNVSRTVLTEKLKSLTGFTPSAFILNARLTLAYKLVMEQRDKMRVSDLAYSVGFSDPKYFSKKFKERYGKSPKQMMDEKIAP